MKRLQGEKDYLCIVGKASEIAANLNKISAIYDFTILTASVQENGTVMVILERRRREDSPGSSKPKNFSV